MIKIAFLFLFIEKFRQSLEETDFEEKRNINKQKQKILDQETEKVS